MSLRRVQRILFTLQVCLRESVLKWNLRHLSGPIRRSIWISSLAHFLHLTLPSLLLSLFSFFSRLSLPFLLLFLFHFFLICFFLHSSSLNQRWKEIWSFAAKPFTNVFNLFWEFVFNAKFLKDKMNFDIVMFTNIRFDKKETKFHFFLFSFSFSFFSFFCFVFHFLFCFPFFSFSLHRYV